MVGVRSLYAKKLDDIENYVNFIKKLKKLKNVNFDKYIFNYKCQSPLGVSVT